MSFVPSLEYHSLDRQLDQLAEYLTVMENRSDRLTHDARQLLQEVRETRQNGHKEIDTISEENN